MLHRTYNRAVKKGKIFLSQRIFCEEAFVPHPQVRVGKGVLRKVGQNVLDSTASKK